MRTERNNNVAKQYCSRSRMRRAAVVLTALATAAGIAVYAGASGAGAAPAPSISSVQAQINSLQGKVDKIGEQSDAAGQQLAAAKSRLAQVTAQADRAQQQYDKASNTLAQVAVSSYENSSGTSIAGLLTSGNPQTGTGPGLAGAAGRGHPQRGGAAAPHHGQHAVHGQAAAAARGRGHLQVAAQYSSQKNSVTKLLDKQKALLDSLNAQQQAAVEAATVGGSTSSADVTTTPIAYTGPTGRASPTPPSQFTYDQLGKPYESGGTGPERPSTARAWSRPPGSRRASRSRAPPRSSGLRCRTSRCRT